MTAEFPAVNPSWNLDPIFKGGVESQEFFEEVRTLESELDELDEILGSLDLPRRGPVAEEVRAGWKSFFDRFFSITARYGEARSFTRALAAAHTDQPRAMRMPSLLDDLSTGLQGLKVELRGRFRGLNDEVFDSLSADERFGSMDLWLRELRRDADQAMDPKLEALAVELNRDGLHAWGRLYTQASSRLEVEVTIEGEKKTFSVGQAKILLESRSRDVRREAYQGLRSAWGGIAPICASAVNAKVGAEQTLYRRRGGDCLTVPLQENRMQRATVDAIFEATAEFQPLLVRYLKAKAKRLGLEKMEWYDRRAPLGEGGGGEKISYTEAQQFIVSQVNSFSPKMADFCKMALAERWVEAEDRAGKAQGGYCTSLPVQKEVRIFMTYGGTSSGVATLAHELGHGYHFWVMRDLPRSEMKVPMGLAETASTLVEALVEQAALREADEAQKLALLDERLGRATAFLMDIPARYQVELAMHEHRAKGTLHDEMLRDITGEAFGASFGDGMGSVNDLFWASKLHFFITQLPFYNFPYSFGYLFSRAVYDRAMSEGAGFVDRIDALLRDTGRMTSEEVGRKYLDADLGDSAFWKSACGSLEEDVRRFEELVDHAADRNGEK